VQEILDPLREKIVEVMAMQKTVRTETERHKKVVQEHIDWVRELGDAKVVEFELNKRINDNEKAYETSYN
jgi:vacuolar-type H+-ATPase subunit I/STV1